MQSNIDFQPSHTPFDFSKYDNPFEQVRIEIIKEMMAPGHGRGAVDIGSGPGFFSKLLKDKGWFVTAIDTDQENLKNASEYAIQTCQGDAIAVMAELQEDQFDLALALEIIEHMPLASGIRLLEGIHKVLKPGGNLLISTPNRYSPEGLAGYYWKELIRQKKKWDAWDNTHVYIYSSWELINILKRLGYAVDSLTGHHYKVFFPKIGSRKVLPIVKSSVFPFNYLGFDVVIKCHKE
jgi:2-polyprenyl-3-methyl-5-hydroxy-6-metoxy-1,4-benzoquinol methylase